jgi:hypothetical protein
VTIPEEPELRQYLQSALEDPYTLEGVLRLLRPAIRLSDPDDEQEKALRAAIESYISPDEFRAIVPGTSLSVKLREIRGLSLTIAAALLTDIATHDPSMGAAVGLVAAALDRVRILTDDELEVLDVLRRLSFGKIYWVWVDEDELIESLAGDDPEEAKRTLAQMKGRGILEEGAGKWRAVW